MIGSNKKTGSMLSMRIERSKKIGCSRKIVHSMTTEYMKHKMIEHMKYL